jgi:hypothetical protein
VKKLLFASLLTFAFVSGWKLGIIPVQPEEEAMKHLLSHIGRVASTW